MLFERDYTIFDKGFDPDEQLLPEHLTYETDGVTPTRKVSHGTKRKTSSKYKSVSGDKKRAHVTNYIAPRKKK